LGGEWDDGRYLDVLTFLVAGFAIAGIGVHHAGLTLDDRRTVEDLYLKGVLRVIISTSVSLNTFA
jgi:hypothetical protein